MNQKTKEEHPIHNDQRGQTDGSGAGCGLGILLLIATIGEMGWYFYNNAEGVFNHKGIYWELMGNPVIYIVLSILVAVIIYVVFRKKS